MKLSNVKSTLPSLSELKFELEDGTAVPAHFHVTEVGLINKKFIDCGGKLREENVANFQLWSAMDHDHRLAPTKLLGIIKKSEEILNMPDLEIEVEYQSDTIGKYSLDFKEGKFILANKQTACLALEDCGIPSKLVTKLSNLVPKNESSCLPGSGCC